MFKVKGCQKNTSNKCLLLVIVDSVIKVSKNIVLEHFWKNVNMKYK